MFLYVFLVYAWGFGVHPMGRDYAALAAPNDCMPPLVAGVFGWETRVFLTASWAYHIVNAVALYACMLCVFAVTARIVRGPFWLGTLAATLFMANPAYIEAVLNVSGIEDLLPCLFGLVAITACVHVGVRPSIVKMVLAFGLVWIASALFRSNALLPAVALLYESIVVPIEKKSRARMVGFGAIGLFSIVLHSRFAFLSGGSVTDRFAPLYFLFYPIGLLPETARRFHEWPWMGWLGALAVLAILQFVVRKAGSRVLLFGFLSAAVVRAGGAERSVDPVHLVGAGQLLLASALYHVGLAAFLARVLQSPKWRLTITTATTLWCIVYFAIQIHQDFTWRHAGRRVAEFQSQAAQYTAAGGTEPIAVCPDYRYYRGAPMSLSESISFDTLFSKSVPHVSILPLHYLPSHRMKLTVEQWNPAGATLRITGVKPIDVACGPDYILSYPDRTLISEAARVHLAAEDAEGFRLKIEPFHTLPRLVLPAAGGDANQGRDALTARWRAALTTLRFPEPEYGTLKVDREPCVLLTQSLY